MAIMTLTRPVTQEDLGFELELESFMEEFNKNLCGPFAAKVNVRAGIIFLGGIRDGWRLVHDSNATWYRLSQNGGHAV